MNKVFTRVNILGTHFHKVLDTEAADWILTQIREQKKASVFTPNPEIVMEAYHNKKLQDILNTSGLVVPDGIGVVIGSKIIGQALPMRVAGYDLVQSLFSRMKDEDMKVFFYGAAPGVAALAKEKMEAAYPGLKVCGILDGYQKDENLILQTINEAQPDLLLVGLGAPKQEYWIHDHLAGLSVKVAFGCGGSFDVMAGVHQRAPKIFIKLGLEWFHRLITQPKRAKRMLRLPVFLFKMFVEGKRYKTHS